MTHRYNVGTKVRTRIHYRNDNRREVNATILAVETEPYTENVKYKISFGPDKVHEEQGCTGCEGYVYEDDIIGLCEDASVGCNCCSGDDAVYWQDNENNAFIDSKGEMSVMAKDKLLRFKVAFCPCCGREF